jgi:hypothetical protein
VTPARVIVAFWVVVTFLFMYLREVATPPGRPDAIDHTLILLTPFVTGAIACRSRSRVAIWICCFAPLLGAWFAWNNNRRLPLSISYGGWHPHILWWGGVTAWTLFIGRLAPSAVWWIRARAVRPPGICRVCGYDLRATPDRCPECGNTPTAA